MNGSHRLLAAAVAFLATTAGPWAAPQVIPPQPQAPPRFKTAVVVVPVDVRVLDADGNPVTDLEQADLTVLEDGVPQPIVHFSRYALAAQRPAPGERASADVPSVTLSPPERRVFLIVFGAASLGTQPLLSIAPSGSVHGPQTIQEHPAKPIDGILRLLRERLLPQDQVALLAYNRASDFTTDHESLANVVEAFRTTEQAGMAALARLGALVGTAAPAGSLYGGPDVHDTAGETLGFAEYVQARNRSAGDRENLQFGLRYLRFMHGEKHLIYVTANGLYEPQPGFSKPGQVREGIAPLAAAANDARVVLHVVQTAGVSSAPAAFLPPLPILRPPLIDQASLGLPTFGAVPRPSGTGGAGGEPTAGAGQPGWDRPPLDPGVATPGTTATMLEAWGDLRTLADLTGGHVSIAGSAAQAIDRIDATTRTGYLLAYAPSDPATDGRYRTITLQVRRPGVSVLFRHGYFGSRAVVPLNRGAIVTEGRIAAAALSTRESRDIRVSAVPTFSKDRKAAGGEMTVGMTIDASRFAWTTDDLSRHVTHLQVLVACGSASQKDVGQVRKQLNLAFADERFAEVMAKGLQYSVTLPLSAPARYVKVVVYNLESNLVGSTLATLK